MFRCKHNPANLYGVLIMCAALSPDYLRVTLKPGVCHWFMFVALKESSFSRVFLLPSWFTRVTSAHRRNWSKWSKREAPFRGVFRCSTVLHVLRESCLFWREALGARLARQRNATLIHIWCLRFIAADTQGSALKSIIYCPAWSNFKTISQSALRLETDTSIILGSSRHLYIHCNPKAFGISAT